MVKQMANEFLPVIYPLVYTKMTTWNLDRTVGCILALVQPVMPVMIQIHLLHRSFVSISRRANGKVLQRGCATPLILAFTLKRATSLLRIMDATNWAWIHPLK